MKLSLDDNSARYMIRAYGPGHVVVNEEIIRTSVVVLPEQLLRDWAPGSFEDITAEHIEGLLALEPEIILLGTGQRMQFPHPRTLAAAAARRVGIEVMDTAAACRTYNILAAESRNVAAALLMI